MTIISRTLEWDSAHRVMRHESKCSTLHGHRYKAEIIVKADVLDDVDRVVDFGVVKQKIGGWIDDFWDHTTLLNGNDVDLLKLLAYEATEKGKKAPYVFFDKEPTAEVMAAELLFFSSKLLSNDRIKVVRVRLWETPNCWAEVEAE